MTTQTGPRLTITGTARAYIGPGAKVATTCFPCEFLTHRGGQSYCRHDPMNGAHIGRTGGTYETPVTCPLLPAARLALARSICNHCGAGIAPDYLGLYAKPTCEKCANERTGDTADECSAARGAGESEE